MIHSIILGLLVIIGYFGVQSLTTTTINQRVDVGSNQFQCKFRLKHTETTVHVRKSRLTCTPNTPRIRSAPVELASGGYTFIGEVKINPTKIISMNVNPETTTLPPTTTSNQTSGAEDVEFKELYNNVSSSLKSEYRHFCGIDPKDEIMRKETKSYTNMAPDQFWENAVVPWSFVSDGDEFAKYAVHIDANVGLTMDDVLTVMAAMRQIEAKTCIKFKWVKPVQGQPWLFISRDARASDFACLISYIKYYYVGQDVASLGDIYQRLGSVPDGDCFPGAYAYYGSDSPQNFVISQTKLSNNDQNDIGLVVHELLHNLGLGHTQKRQDASENIDIKWGNIKPGNTGQYEACIEANDPSCKRYNHYGTPYDCMSIMHYRDYFFITDAASASGGKTMVAKKAGCDLSSPASKLSDADISILKKMYCTNTPQAKVVISPNHPSNYPDNQDKEYPISVDVGHVIGLWFTDFKIEDEASCAYDWVEVVDGDGTVLLAKTCGMTRPGRISSRTKSLTVKFHSDSSENFAGFRAEYEQVASAPTTMNGGWSNWSGFSACTNGRDGKSICKKKRVRYCNNPAATNDGAPCAGVSEMYEDCVPPLANPSQNRDCVISGGWSLWSAFSTCSTSCTSTKTRTCTNPTPLNSKECEGEAFESSSCTGGNCPSSTGGSIKSTNFPSNYPDNDDLEFPLVVEAGSTVLLTFTDFDLEVDSACGYDYVKVLDTDGSTQLANLCGNILPSTIRSSGNKLTVVFHSDRNINKKGFQATWTKVSGSYSGEVTSPRYPRSYPDNQEQVKTISVPNGARIKLTFTHFNIEFKDNSGTITCPYDKLTVYDSSNQSGNKLVELCGSSLASVSPNPIVSTGNALTLVFTSDGSVVFSGFRATWKQI